MSDCSAFEAKYKDLTPNSKPEEAQPLLEALKEVNQIRLLNSDVQKQAEAQAAGSQKGGLLMSNFALDGGESLVTVIQREGKIAAINLKHANGNTEALRYDNSIVERPATDTINIACSAGKTIQSDFDLDKNGKPTKNFILLPNNVEIETDANGIAKAIRQGP